jgi:hypothetical protein
MFPMVLGILLRYTLFVGSSVDRIMIQLQGNLNIFLTILFVLYWVLCFAWYPDAQPDAQDRVFSYIVE